MRILTKEETPDILPIKRGRNTQLRAALLQLQVGETLFMPRDEWKTKNTPHYIVSRVKKTHGFLFEYGMKTDDSGWLFRRTA